MSLRILEEYKKKDSRIVVIDKIHEGPIETRRAGFFVSKGEYVSFVDSDDWIENNMYSDLMALMCQYDGDVVTSGFIREYEDGVSIDAYEGIERGVYKGTKLYELYFSNIIGTEEFFEFNVPGSVSNKIFKRAILEKYIKNVPKEITMGEDPAISYPILVNSNMVIVSGENYYHYRIRKGSITSKENDCDDINDVKLLFEYIDDVLESRYKLIPSLKMQIELWKVYIVIIKWPERVLKKTEKCLFPYGDIDVSDRIILYGNGRFCKFFCKYMKEMRYNVIGVADKRKQKGVLSIEDIKNIEFDKLIISVIRANEVRSIKNMLLEEGVDEKIIKSVDCELLKKYINEGEEIYLL